MNNYKGGCLDCGGTNDLGSLIPEDCVVLSPSLNSRLSLNKGLCNHRAAPPFGDFFCMIYQEKKHLVEPREEGAGVSPWVSLSGP